MSIIFWILFALGVIAVIGIGINLCWAKDTDSFLYRKYTTGDEYLDPYGNPTPVNGAKNGQ